MGAGRRKFTKEFKEEAIRRLGLGVSLAEVARACEVSPTYCTAGGGSCRSSAARLSSATGSARWRIVVGGTSV